MATRTTAAIEAAKSAIQSMTSGEAIFVGPIEDNAGNEVLPAGTTYGPYAPELQKTGNVIEGVIGSVG